MPVDRSEFYNSPEKLVTVYQKINTRTETYTYDAMGNRTSEKILLRKEYGYTYTYYPNSNRLQSKVKQDGTERADYAYDANGNLTSKIVTKGEKIDIWEYSFDLFNQLEQVKKNGEVVSSYIYDPNGFRVEKNGSKGKVHYVPLLNGEVGYRKEFSGNAEYSFIYVGGQKLARVNGVVGGSGKKVFYQNDHLGLALAVTDEFGNRVVERDFAPFGERLQLEENDGIKPDEDGSGFTGKDWDEDVGLYYYNARFYDPEIGRFISEDSEMDDPNSYGYCFNNPVNNIDPSGHWSLPTNALGWASTILSAAAILTGDKNLGMAAGAFGLFLTIRTAVIKAQIQDALKKLAEANESAPDPVDTASDPSGDGTGESGEGTQAANTPVDNSTGNSGTPDNTANDNATVGPEIETLTPKDILIDRIQNGQIDLSTNINDLMNEWGVDPKYALEIIKAAVHYKVSTFEKDDKTGFVHLNSFGKILGLKYGRGCSEKTNTHYWGTTTFVEQILTGSLYWNYLHPNSYIAIGDISIRTGKPFGHAEHLLGTDVDLYVYWDGNNLTNIQPTRKGSTNLKILGNKYYQGTGKPRIQEFLNMMNTIYPNTFHQIIWCDWTVKGVIPSVKTDVGLRYQHRHHIHLGYENEP